jgi:hypothetical protein
VSAPTRSGGRVAVAALIFAGTVGLAGCGGWAPYPAPTGAVPDGDVVELSPAPDDLGCDAIGVPYGSVTFVIDPTAGQDVTVETDLGTTLATAWQAGFVGGPAADRTVLDASGAVVARDGEVLEIPKAAWPNLHGYFVCPSLSVLYVLHAEVESLHP